MQHFRKITSLAEDMAALGLAGKKDQPDAGSNSLSESRKSSKKPGQALKESTANRKARVKENRKRRLARRESAYRLRVQALVKLSESKNIAPRLNIRLKGALAKGAKVMESIDLSKVAAKSMRRSDMIKAFETVSTIAGKLARKYAVVEELMDASGIPVEHPGSEYGLDVDKTNVRDGNKTGDATDYADGKSGAAGEVEEADDAWDDDKKKKDDVEEASDWGDDDKDMKEAEEGDDDKDMKEEEDKADDKDMEEECSGDDEDMKEDEDEKKKDDAADAKMEQARRRAAARLESMPMDFELNAVRLEAENMAAQIVGGTVGPVLAGSVLNDMVSYLGGALSLYQDLASDMENAYVGQGGPDNDDGPAEIEKDNPEAYIGKEGPEGESALNQGGIDASVPGKTDTAGGKSEAKKPAPGKAKTEAAVPAKPAAKSATPAKKK